MLADAHPDLPAPALDDRAGQPVHDPHEVGDEQVGRALVDLARPPVLLQHALVKDRDAIGQRHRLGLVVGDVDEGDAGAPLQALELAAHPLAQLGVEVGERLVEQQDRGLDHQRARERHPLLLAAAELRRLPALEPLEADRREHAGDALADLGAAAAGEPEPEGYVLEDAHVRPDRVVLEHHAHLAPLGRDRGLGRGEQRPGDPDLAGVGHEEAREQAQRRGLAAAGRAEQRHELLLLDREAHVLEDLLAAEALAQPLDDDVRHCALLGHRDVGRDP